MHPVHDASDAVTAGEARPDESDGLVLLIGLIAVAAVLVWLLT